MQVNKRNNPEKALGADQLNFTHGVASGDPLPTSVILWTRCSPSQDDVTSNATTSGYVPLYNPVPIYNSSGSHIPVSNAPVCVQYKVASDKALKHVVDSGTLYTSSDVDYTVKVEAQHLKPFTYYYYQFNVCDSSNASPVGRTKTSPKPTDDVDEVGLAVYSCSNFPFGFFNAFNNPAVKDSVDYVIHLGDVLYEYKEGDYGDSGSQFQVSRANSCIKDGATVSTAFPCLIGPYTPCTTTGSDTLPIVPTRAC